MEKSSKMNCLICLAEPLNAVAIPCGHIFCWKCLNQWINSRDKIECPICRNGFEKKDIIRLFIENGKISDDINDIPKHERVDPVRNRDRSTFQNFSSMFFNQGNTNDNDNGNIQVKIIKTNYI